MIKRTMLLGSPMYVRTELEQLVIERDGVKATRPIEDIGYVVVEHPQVKFSTPALQKLASANVTVVFCGSNFMPNALLLPMDQHYTSGENTRAQVAASIPLRKKLWKQTVKAKLRNQAQLLEEVGGNSDALQRLARSVKSGDTGNAEAEGARRYWPQVFRPYYIGFRRDRLQEGINQFLNYGYSILRSATARALVGAGLHPTFGIFHHNKYNAFCLADDVMEPYRPCVERILIGMLKDGLFLDGDIEVSHKKELLALTQLEVMQNGTPGALMVALQRTAWSLAACYQGEANKINYPTLV